MLTVLPVTIDFGLSGRLHDSLLPSSYDSHLAAVIDVGDVRAGHPEDVIKAAVQPAAKLFAAKFSPAMICVCQCQPDDLTAIISKSCTQGWRL